MILTIELPDDVAAQMAAAGIAPEEAPHFAVALMREALRSDDLSPEDRERLHESIREGLQAEAEGRYRPADAFFAEFEKRHDIRL